MPNITSITPQAHNPRRVNVYVDGDFVGGLSLDLIEEAGLRVGATIDPAGIERLIAADDDFRALDNAYNFLSYRPRSVREVRQRLRKKGYEPALIDRTVDRLHAQGLLDDAAFADYWRQNRESFSPRGSRLLRLELRQKGIDAETATEATADVDDIEGAYRAGQKPAKRFAGLPYPEFQQKLGGFFVRRGFDYDVIREVLPRLWQETGGRTPEDDE